MINFLVPGTQELQNFDPKIRRDLQKKNSYERRDYESVDENSLS